MGRGIKLSCRSTHSLFDEKETACAFGMVTLEDSAEAANTIKLQATDPEAKQPTIASQ